MRKAFLCHSSTDKDYVRVIARRLGRAKLVFDEVSFNPGQDFRDAIIQGMDASSLFIFFASRPSLESVWCRFEIDAANLRSIYGTIKSHLTVIIDPLVTFNDLPKWMQSTKVQIQTRPTLATRDIQQSLLNLYATRIDKPFIGRQPQQMQFTDNLTSTVPPPRVFIINGLDGIGRRTYIEHVSKNILSLNFGPSFLVEETRGLEDLYLWVLDETADLGTRAHMAEELNSFLKLSESAKIHEIVLRLHILCDSRCIPCLVDMGGMLDEFGAYKPEYIHLLDVFSSTDEDYYLVLIHKRSPLIDFNDKRFLAQKLPHLSDNQTKLLLTRLFRTAEINFDEDSVSELVPYLDGYPPSAYFSASFSKKYTLSALLADKSALADFNAKTFTRFMIDLNLTELEWLILRYLRSESTVPLSAILIATNSTPEVIVPLLINLIDLSLVVAIDDNFAIASPIKAAISRIQGFLGIDVYDRLAKELTNAFWSKEDAAPSLEIVDATLNAVARSGSTDFSPYQDLVRVSTVHRLAQECYYKKEWELAREYSARAERMDSDRVDVKALHFKTLVQLERWTDPESVSL
jgi:hypothetical protein